MHTNTLKGYARVMSDKKRILVNGRLKGMDRDIPCKVSGLKVPRAATSLDATVFEIRDIALVDPPKDLPDGIYELAYEGSGERFTKHGDVWQLL